MQQTTNTETNVKNNIQPKLKTETKGMKLSKSKQDYIQAANAFLTGKVGKFGKYFAVENALVYRTIISNQGYGEKKLAQNIIARKIKTDKGMFMIANSSVLPLIGRSVSFGNEKMNRNVTDVQLYLQDKIPTIPFTVFDEANLDLNKYRLLDRGNEYNVTRKIPNPKYSSWDREDAEEKGKTYEHEEFIEETVHFTGASLFEVDGSVFLFDIDQEEIKHKIFNPFLVKIPVYVETISEAYSALKPQEVVDAEKMGLKVERQGEWFFIPIDDFSAKKMMSELDDRQIFKGKLDRSGNVDRWHGRSFRLKAGPNRPNHAQNGFEYKGKAYVSGVVSHSGREHRNVMLKQWCYAIPNTAIESFTITGDVD